MFDIVILKCITISRYGNIVVLLYKGIKDSQVVKMQAGVNT